jgi:hypothetical protein
MILTSPLKKVVSIWVQPYFIFFLKKTEMRRHLFSIFYLKISADF